MSDVREICNLPEAEFEARRKFLRETLVPRVRGREDLEDGVALRFDATPAMRAELDEFVAFERECCGDAIAFAVEEAGAGLRLEIRGVDPGASVFAAVAPTRAAPPVTSGWLLGLRSAGLGAVGAFVLFCVVPAAVAALVGGKLADSLLALDDAWVVAAGTLVFGGLLWAWERRRRAVRVAEGSAADGCGC